MAETQPVKIGKLPVKEKIIVALDVENSLAAEKIIDEIGGAVGAFKIGLQLFTSAGAKFVEDLTARGHKIFLDLKFHDIPNTVAKAAVEAARLGVWMFNVHASGGGEMMRRTAENVAEFCDQMNIVKPEIIAVTILTGTNQQGLTEIGIEKNLTDQVVKLARLTAESRLSGVVASPLEAVRIRETVERENFLIVTPGIRPLFATNDDQKRVMSPKEAVAAGSDYLVIGRPITQAANKISAVEKIIEEIGAN